MLSLNPELFKKKVLLERFWTRDKCIRATQGVGFLYQGVALISTSRQWRSKRSIMVRVRVSNGSCSTDNIWDNIFWPSWPGGERKHIQERQMWKMRLSNLINWKDELDLNLNALIDVTHHVYVWHILEKPIQKWAAKSDAVMIIRNWKESTKWKM